MYLIKQPKHFTKIQNILKISTEVIENIFEKEIKEFNIERVKEIKELIENKDKNKIYHDSIDLATYLNIFLQFRKQFNIVKSLGEDSTMFKRFLEILKKYRNYVAHNKNTEIKESELCSNVYLIMFLFKAIRNIDPELVKMKYIEYFDKIYLELNELCDDEEEETQ
jgi:hypothetical protein